MIKLLGVYKTYTIKNINTIALRDVNINIERGEFISITGPSGSGKSTLLNIIGCMDCMDQGEYIFDNINVKNLKSKELSIFRNKKIGFVFQSYNLISNFTALENVEAPMGYAGIDIRKRRAAAYELLEKLNIKEKANNLPSEMSGGEQQRVAIARALANNPDIILADEPTGNLDRKNSFDIMKIFKELNDGKKTILVVTHDEKIAEYAKRVIKIEDGKVIIDIIV